MGPRANKHIFIRYCENSKGYVMYGEHPDRGRTKIDSRDVEFIENDFPKLGDTVKNLDLYELEKDEELMTSLSE